MNRTQKRHVYTAEMIRSKIIHAVSTAKSLRIPIDSDHYIRLSRNTNNMGDLNKILQTVKTEINNSILTTQLKLSVFEKLVIKIKRMLRCLRK